MKKMSKRTLAIAAAVLFAANAGILQAYAADVQRPAAAAESAQQMGQPGKILHAEQAPYGFSKFKGRVVVSARVDEKGKVIRTTVMVSSGDQTCDKMACRLVQTKWKFEPATDAHGQKIVSDIMCPVYFNMKPEDVKK